MLVLHAHWQPPAQAFIGGTFHFWAETSDTPQPSRHNLRSHKAQAHPFAATALTVRSLLIHLAAHKAHPITIDAARSVELSLPSVKGVPLPSPLLIHTWNISGEGELMLAPWRIPACATDLAATLSILQTLPGDVDLTPDIRISEEVRFWQITSHLVLELIAQQKVLPGLAQEGKKGDALAARWRPVTDGPRDAPRLAQLRQAMPPVCRAQWPSPPRQSDHTSEPQHLLTSFLEAMTDALAREWSTPAALPCAEQGVAQAWLQALARDDAQIRASTAQLNRLRSGHQAWLRSLYAAGDEHLRVVFRLDAPAQAEAVTPNQQWSLHYLLQAREDPSLLAPATELWRARRDVVAALRRRMENAPEILLTGLGFAARLFAPIRDSLQDKRPAAAHFSNQEAYTFLREVAPTLEESGFGVLVPPWWNRPGTRLGARLRLRGKGGAEGGVAAGLVSFDNLVNYQWEIALGGETLSREEFEAIVALKTPLVQVRGQWVRLDPEQIEAAIRFWDKSDQQGDVGLLNALHMGLNAEEINGLPLDEVEFEGWLQSWMQRFTRQETLALQPVPAGLQAQLRPYQHYGYSWLDFQRRWGISVCLADDMGLGKTLQTLSLLLHVKEEMGRLPAPALLICPTSVVLNWAQEAARFTPALTLLVHQGSDRLQGDALLEAAQEVDMVVTSYALIRRDAQTLQQQEWFSVILDEAQNIKNATTKQAQTIRRLSSSFRLALTGTPVENRLSELWSILHFLNPGFLGSQENFRRHFALPIERYNDTKAASTLRRLTSPFILRRVKTDPTVIQDLPEKQETKAYCTLTQEQATLYEAVVQDALRVIAEAEDLQRRGLVLAMLMKLKQICNHPAQFMHQIGDGSMPNGDAGAVERRSGKLARLVELTEELLAVGDRALVFTQFAEMGNLLCTFLQHRLGIQTLFLHGGVPARQRAAMVARFQEEANGPPIFILSLKAGGTGLNLTRANHVFHYDRWWNPAVEDQATDRAFRIGQQRNVQVHKFVCMGTLEEKIDAMIESKKLLAQSIVGRGENWLTELSTNDLRDLVTLRHELVE
jgi:SNF2 family DNA or RNA helicase